MYYIFQACESFHILLANIWICRIYICIYVYVCMYVCMYV